MDDKLSTKYNDAVQQIKSAILRSQAKALAGVNQEQLALYYGIGRYISQNSREGVWGKDAIATISRQLSAELPGLKGFSPRNLRNMRTFYEEWRVFDTKLSATTDDTNLAATTAKSKTNDNLAVATAKINPDEQLMVMPLTEVPVAAFFSIGFTHHITILSKVKTQEERYYYIQLCHNMSLTVDELELRISENAYAHRGQMPNNFNHAIADYKQAFRAIQMFKDEYLLDYINVEQLGIRDEDLDETVIENEIVHNVMARMGDKELWQFLRERHAIDEPLKVQSIEKAQRNDIILSCLDKGAGLRQLSRITGVTYGVIYRLQGRR